MWCGTSAMRGSAALLFVFPPMTESAFALFLLSVIAVCAVVMTATMVVTARQARRTFRRMNALLPHCRQTVRQARRLLARADHVVSQTEMVVSAVSAAAAHTMNRFIEAKRRLERWLHLATNGNGSGAGGGARSFRHRMKG